MCGSAIEQRHGAHVHVDVRVHMGECLVMGTSVYGKQIIFLPCLNLTCHMSSYDEGDCSGHLSLGSINNCVKGPLVHHWFVSFTQKESGLSEQAFLLFLICFANITGKAEERSNKTNERKLLTAREKIKHIAQ